MTISWQKDGTLFEKNKTKQNKNVRQACGDCQIQKVQRIGTIMIYVDVLKMK